VLAFFKDEEIFGGIKSDEFYCGPYRRSMDTIAETAAFYGKEILTDERLRERRKDPGGNEYGMFQKRWARPDQERPGKTLLYGTGNQAKLSAMQRRLSPLSLKIIGLKDIAQKFPQVPTVEEDGATPLQNAEKKALAYYRAFRMPVFSCDSGLYFEGVPEEEQPGVHVRNVAGRTLTDAEMLEHYAGMAEKYGGLKAVYRNAICLVIDEDHIHRAMEKSMESEPFLITSRPHKDGIREKGFPLDCLSVHIGTGKYYYDLPGTELDQIALEDGFLAFFEQYMAEL